MKRDEMIQIPTYHEALERHETPLDIFISRWEPVNHKSDTKAFREDLAALIEYVNQQNTQAERKP